MSVQILFNDGQSQEVLPFDANRRIQSVRFILGSTTLELMVSSNHPDGSSSPGVILPQPSPQPAAAADNATDLTNQASHSENPAPAAGGEEADKEEQGEEYMKKMRGWIMVVATLIAAMMFQAGMNPPGGFWQDDLDSDIYPLPPPDVSNITRKDETLLNITTHPSVSSILGASPSNQSRFSFTMTTTLGSPKNVTGHRAGDPVWADRNPNRYTCFLAFSASTLCYSLCLILALLNQKVFHSTTYIFDLKNYAVCNVVSVWICYGIGMATKHDYFSINISLILVLPGYVCVVLILQNTSKWCHRLRNFHRL